MSVSESEGKVRRRPRWLRRVPREEPLGRRKLWWVALLLGAMALWFAPSIVAWTGVVDTTLAKTFADLRGTVTARSASLGWFSGVTLYDVEVRDSAGGNVAFVPVVSGSKSLLSLLSDKQRVGVWRLERPRISVVLGRGGSNLEDVFAAWFRPNPNNPRIEAGVEVVEGSVQIVDRESSDRWQIDQVALDVHLPADPTQAITVRTTGALPQASAASRFEADLTLNSQSPATEPGELTFRCDAFPLHLVDGVLRRAAPNLHVAGWLGSTITASWDQRQGVVVDAQIDAEQFRLSAPGLRDELRFARLHAPCKLIYKQGWARIESLDLQCDAGKVKFQGDLPLTLDGAALAARTTGTLEGRVGLAELARLLPNTLHVRNETQVTSGHIDVKFTSGPGKDGWKWDGRLEMGDVIAVRGGQQIAWKQPLLVTLAAHQDAEGHVSLDKLYCESSFLELEAEGNPRSLTAAAKYDLNQLAGKLQNFLDLKGMKLAGDGWSYVTWQKNDTGQVEASVEVQLRDFELISPDKRPWREPHLVLTFEARGLAEGFRPGAVQEAKFHVEGGSDGLEAELKQPLASWRDPWPLEIQMNGDLARWRSRLEPWLPQLAGWDLRGEGDFLFVGAYEPKNISVTHVQAGIRQFHAWGPGLFIDEPTLDLEANGSLEPAAGRGQLDFVAVNCSAVSAEARQIAFYLPDDGVPRLTGNATYTANLNRLSAWTVDPKRPPAWRAQGDLEGQVSLRRRVDGIDLQLASTVRNLSYLDRPRGEPWRQNRVDFTAAAVYDDQADILRIDQWDLGLKGARAKGAGHVVQFSTRRILELAGQMEYDLVQLQPHVVTFLGEAVELEGQGSRPFRFRAPLGAPPTPKRVGAERSWWQDVAAALEFEWSKARLYGIEVGPTAVAGELADGLIRTSPIEFTFRQGRVAFVPGVRLAPEPVEVYVDQGRVIDQLELTPEMCQRALKYAAPVLAGATELSGRFSIDLARLRMNLKQPEASDLAGQLTVHEVQVGVGSAPLVKELATLLGYRQPARLSEQSVVDFALADGRVHHRNLRLAFDNFVIQTSGSVGLDQSLQLVAEMPVPANIVNRLPEGPARTALLNRTVRLPIGGTLQQPKIDSRALNELAGNFVRDAATDAARDLFERESNRLFDRLLKPNR